MAPPRAVVEWQTYEIIKCLLGGKAFTGSRRLLEDDLETDGPTEKDGFDPVPIADKLRTLADELDNNATFRATMDELKKAVAQEAVVAAFSQGVEALCQTRVSQGAEVAPEMQLIRASVSLGLYILKSSPELKTKVEGAMTAFLNGRVGSWLTQQGGWGNMNV